MCCVPVGAAQGAAQGAQLCVRHVLSAVGYCSYDHCQASRMCAGFLIPGGPPDLLTMLPIGFGLMFLANLALQRGLERR